MVLADLPPSNSLRGREKVSSELRSCDNSPMGMVCKNSIVKSFEPKAIFLGESQGFHLWDL